MMWQSHKARDLLHDDRLLVHSITTTRDGTEGEVKLERDRVPTEDLAVRARHCDAVEVLGCVRRSRTSISSESRSQRSLSSATQPRATSTWRAGLLGRSSCQSHLTDQRREARAGPSTSSNPSSAPQAETGALRSAHGCPASSCAANRNSTKDPRQWVL
jgi:hypothetical protein